ncbi:MAG TPA: hypothetical protein VLJ86_15070 [Ramlibacter sp.]|nr:hypothetical protein [Ramlibacter sp.]
MFANDVQADELEAPATSRHSNYSDYSEDAGGSESFPLIRDRVVGLRDGACEHKGAKPSTPSKSSTAAKLWPTRSDRPDTESDARLRETLWRRLTSPELDLLSRGGLATAFDIIFNNARRPCSQTQAQAPEVDADLSGGWFACVMTTLLQAHDQARVNAKKMGAATHYQHREFALPIKFMAYRMASLNAAQIEGLIEGVAAYLGSKLAPSRVVDMLVPTSVAILMCTREDGMHKKAQAVFAGCRVGLNPSAGLWARINGRHPADIDAALAKAAAKAVEQSGGRLKSHELLASLTTGSAPTKAASKGDAKYS